MFIFSFFLPIKIVQQIRGWASAVIETRCLESESILYVLSLECLLFSFLGYTIYSKEASLSTNEP